jgi:2-aminoadipate transaminase
LDSGHAYPAILPDLTAEAERVLTTYRSQALQYGPKQGIPELREWITSYSRTDGVSTSADRVLVTNGAKQALELVCRLLLDEGDSVVMTSPTYFTAIPIFRSFGARFIEVGQDEQGIDVDQIASIFAELQREGRPLPKFIYDVPEFHNPTGLTTSLSRRQSLVDLAAKWGVYIVEDSPYRRIRFEGSSIAPLKAIDPEDYVFHVGTFSKLIAPGIRVGWVSSSAEMIARLVQLKADSGSSPLTQRIVHEFCAAGKLNAHTERVVATYRTHRDRIVSALRRELPEISMTVPSGGYYIWLRLPSGIDGDELAKQGAQEGVSVLPGSKFYAAADIEHPKNFIRVAYTHATPDEIDEGVRRLASAFHAVESPPREQHAQPVP